MFINRKDNIFKELKSNLGIIASSGNLEKWAEQGVLLLNTVLTVEQGNSNSHRKKGWEKLTTQIIQKLNFAQKNLVFILWGKQAQKAKKFISETNHLIIESAHPSPLSAYRGFWDSKPFSRTNEYLILNGKSPIDWQI